MKGDNYTLTARYYNGAGKQELYAQHIRAASQAYNGVVERISNTE